MQMTVKAGGLVIKRNTDIIVKNKLGMNAKGVISRGLPISSLQGRLVEIHSIEGMLEEVSINYLEN